MADYRRPAARAREACDLRRVHDVVTHFLPRMPHYRGIRIDHWCAAASQVGYFEELGLFLASDPVHGADTGVLTPLSPSEHLGGWGVTSRGKRVEITGCRSTWG